MPRMRDLATLHSVPSAACEQGMSAIEALPAPSDGLFASLRSWLRPREAPRQTSFREAVVPARKSGRLV